MNIAYNIDCMEYMETVPDNYFDLAVVDPPYGGTVNKRFGERFDRYDKIFTERRGGGWAGKFGNGINDWDIAPTENYFDELFRVSKNQIIWGGELLLVAAYTLLFDLAQAYYYR